MDIQQYLLQKTAYQKGDKIAIALSGGADSMALLTMACEMIGAQFVVAVTFDHRIRKESFDEALFAAEYCAFLGCQHEILRSDIVAETKVSQSWARQMRYKSLIAYCELNQIIYLLTAHHEDDQKETYYIRVLQNSHLWGAAGMADFSQKGRVTILRPLLHSKASDLRGYLQERKVKWIDDPSNKNPKYLRSRIRLQQNKDGFPHLALRHIQNYRNIMSCLLHRWIQQYLYKEAAGYIQLPKEEFNQQAMEFKIHLLRLLLQYVSCKPYSITLQHIENLYNDILSSKLFSIGGCLVFADKMSIYIQKEYRKENKEHLFSFQGKISYWNNRFRIEHSESMPFTVCSIGGAEKEYAHDLHNLIKLSQKKRYHYIKSLPFVIYNKNTLLLPEIDQRKWQKDGLCLSLLNYSPINHCQKYFI